MKRKQWIALGLVFCLLLSLAACKGESRATVYDLHPTQPTQNNADSTTAANGVESEDETTAARPNQDTNAYSFEVTFNCKSGYLLYTVTDARVVNRQGDIPAEGGFKDAVSVFQFQNGEPVIYDYPDMILDDGSFVENCSLILVDVTVESKDAVAYTISDEDAEAAQKAMYDDPCIFRVDTIFLADLGERQGDRYCVTDMVYFSLLGEQEEHPFAFRLEPGETVSFTIGYMIGGYKGDGTLTDLTQLCICDSYGALDGTYIRLGLGG